MSENINVVVARFQVPYLTFGHTALLNYALQYRAPSKTVVVLGVADKPSRRDPLPFEMRRDMVLDYVGKSDSKVFMVLPLRDVPDNDTEWSLNLDHLLQLVFPHGDILLLSGRDGFKKHYDGNIKAVEVKHFTEYSSGTSVREDVRTAMPNDIKFRQGVIWAVTNYFPQEGWQDYEV